MDVLTKAQRSRTMASIKSKWTRPEKKVRAFLLKEGIGYIAHPSISGNPDFVLKGKKVAIFINGCFWHMCPKCFVHPKTNKHYWLPKLQKNVMRDKIAHHNLSLSGYKVIVIWEHQFKENPDRAFKKLGTFVSI